MAQTSKRLRKLRRSKREVSQLSKMTRIQSAQQARHLSILFSMLAQSGPVTITKGTFDAVVSKLQVLRYDVKQTSETELVVSLVEPAIQWGTPDPITPEQWSLIDAFHAHHQAGLDLIGSVGATSPVDAPTEPPTPLPATDLQDVDLPYGV